MSKDGLKHYPLNRFVVNRDGNGNVLEIVTKERIDRKVLGLERQVPSKEAQTAITAQTKTTQRYTPTYDWMKVVDAGYGIRKSMDKILPGSRSTAPKNASPWLVLRFNTVDGEDYGRGRVEEFIGDLRSLNGLAQVLSRRC